MPTPSLAETATDAQISPAEIRLGRYLLLAFLLIVTLPYAFAALVTPEGFVWGGLLFSADDQNVHLMWARQAHDGGFFFRDLYTTEGLISGERPLFWNVLPWLMGLLSHFSGLEVAFWYHIFRVACAALALWQLHALTIAVTRGEERYTRARLWTLALAIFTTGAGFLAPILGGVSWLDRPDNPGAALVPEAFFLLSALVYPLNIASFALLAFVFRQITVGRGTAGAFVGALLLGNIHTYDALPLLGVTLVWALWQLKGARRESLVALAAFAGALLPVLYQSVVFKSSAEFRIKALTLTQPPAPQHIVLSLLPLLLLAAWGWIASKELPARRMMLLWVVVTAGLMYAPISFGRKLIEGLQLPLLVLGGLGLAALTEKLAARRRELAAGVFVAILAISPLQTVGWILNNAIENNFSRLGVLMPVLYLSEPTVEALHELDRQPQGAVLCLPLTGAYVPRATGKYTYFGHWAESLDPNTKRAQTFRFLGGQMSPGEAPAFFKANGIRYILDTPLDRKLVEASGGGTFSPQELGLKSLFSKKDALGTVNLYEVPASP